MDSLLCPWGKKAPTFSLNTDTQLKRSLSTHGPLSVRVNGAWLRLRAVSLFSWSVEQNARDTQMTTRVTEDARRDRHGCRPRFSRLAASLLNARARVHLLKLKKKRGCSQSRLDCNIHSFYCTFLKFFSTHSTFSTLRAPYSSPNMSLFIRVGTTIIFGGIGGRGCVVEMSQLKKCQSFLVSKG